MQKLITAIRLNGTNHFNETVPIRQIVYANLLWAFSFLTITINAIGALLIYQDFFGFIIGSFLVEQGALWFIFLLTRLNYFDISRRLFLAFIYCAICWHDLHYGKTSFTFLFYFAFLPSAFNIFSIKRNKIALIGFLLLPLSLLLFSEYSGYNLIAPLNNSETVLQQIRLQNIICSFCLFVIYAGYIIINSGYKQNKFIHQSISLQTTLDNALGGIWSIDEKFNLLATNKAFSDFIEHEFGYKNLVAGNNLKAALAKAEIPSFILTYFDKVLSGQDLLETFNYKGQDFELKATPIKTENGKQIIGATFIALDITERLASEKLLLVSKQKAEAASLAKERFLSNMSHELRTPLNGIIGITNILLDEKYLIEQEKQFETLKNLSEHTIGVINNILDLSKIDADKSQLNNNRFYLKAFLKKINSIFENTSKLKQIDFSIDINTDDDIYLNGDEIKLSQVLINLIGNAIKFTDKGFVKLKIDVEPDSVEDSNYNFKFSVTDSGIGIHQKNIDKIFESFTQADSNTTRKFGGTGLGITISDKILQMMDSKLQVTSKYGEGSTFSFSVALKKSSFIAANASKLLDPENYSLEGLSILLAEDNKVNQLVAKRFLEKWKAKVTLADNGKIAYGEAMEHDFDIILMDLDMPIMDGYQSTYLIKQTKSKIPIIALTAASFEDMHAHLAKKGFVDIIQKPFMPEELFKKIAQIVELVDM
jgi:signal transduction histidine kinase/CheY-like chemotaxis protein